MNSYPKTSNFDNLLLQTLMNKLQIRHPNPLQPQLSPLLNQTLEDLLFDTINNITIHDQFDDENNGMNKTHLAKEESKLEKEVIKIIVNGNADEMLKPNSGQAIAIGEHHICVGFHEETGSEYRVWEWHGHVMLFDDENGYNLEYIYGNYFERLRVVNGKMKEEKSLSFGLKELIGSNDDCGSGRVLHQNMNVGSSSV
ncbi:hypothetical protein QVD17_11530 [Tagetes erecta]|uniref:Uncharacterized protein n=1 Tax=Tagetes erecta TaxID=13708 RepID=A0AAD8KXH6_TARER|nr:hypothetical protein QVD17_11530 [Tagetes erecta]